MAKSLEETKMRVLYANDYLVWFSWAVSVRSILIGSVYVDFAIFLLQPS